MLKKQNYLPVQRALSLKDIGHPADIKGDK